MDRKEKGRRIEDLDVDAVVKVLEKGGMKEFEGFVRDRQIDGLRLLDVSEGIVKLWKPKCDAKKFILFIQELKQNPDKYLSDPNKDEIGIENFAKNCTNERIIPITMINEDKTKTEVSSIESKYQTVNVKKKTEHQAAALSGIEEIVRRIVPAKSFLYRNHQTDKPVACYVPMDPGNKKKQRNFFRLSSYEFSNFGSKQFRFSKTENFNDRGYYSIKGNNRHFLHKPHRDADTRKKYTSLTTSEEMEKYQDEHFYEDLNYCEIDKGDNDLKETSTAQKPYKVKLQDLFQSFKLPFFKKQEEVTDNDKKEICEVTKPESNLSENDAHIYENSDTMSGMYDSVHVNKEEESKAVDAEPKLPVEEYLEPVQLSKEYSDVMSRQKDDSILGYILSLFENKFGIRREINEPTQLEASEDDKGTSSQEQSKPAGPMTDRPLPIPVENEPYFMNVDRSEAESMLKGQPDGVYILRPSSQPNHVYTLTVSCSNMIHNVGVRRRPDGRLALGFARRGERSFTSVSSLLRHHKRQRLLLITNGNVCGSTTLNETIEYYQTPSNLPVVPCARSQ